MGEMETWAAWLDGSDEVVYFEVPADIPGGFDVAQAGAEALGVDVCDALNVAKK